MHNHASPKQSGVVAVRGRRRDWQSPSATRTNPPFGRANSRQSMAMYEPPPKRSFCRAGKQVARAGVSLVWVQTTRSLIRPDTTTSTVIRRRAWRVAARRQRIPHGSCVVRGGFTCGLFPHGRVLSHVGSRPGRLVHRRLPVCSRPGMGRAGHRLSVPAMLRVRRGRRGPVGSLPSPGWRPSPAGPGPDDYLGAVPATLQFGEDAGHVVTDGLRAEEEPLGDCRCWRPRAGDEVEHLGVRGRWTFGGIAARS